MNKLVKISAFIAFVFYTFPTQATEVSSQVSNVTIYPSKAREIRAGKLTIQELGEQEIIFKDISRYMDPQSIQIAIPGVSIMSVSSRVNYLGKKSEQNQIKSWRDSLQKVQDQRTWLQEKIAVSQGELNLYDKNSVIGGEQTALYPKAIEDLANQYKIKTLKIRETLFQLRQEDKSLDETIKKLQEQINSIAPTNQPVQEVVVKAIVSKIGQFDYQLNYMVSNVSWNPIYDIHSKSLSQALSLKMKAQVIQQTGYDWKNVQVFLSTAQPQTNQKMPAWRTDFIDYKTDYEVAVRYSGANMIQAKAMSAPMISAESQDDAYRVDIIESATAQLYQISRPQNLPSTKDAQFIEIQSIEVPAIYQYETMPKRDLGVYLVAKVPQWETYNLLNGNANLFFEDTYVGQIQLNAKVAKDTLDISLGKDELVFIDRKEIKNVSSKKIIGSSKREDKIFEITIKNNKKSNLDIVVYDQIPVSRQKDIEVILNDNDKAVYNAENGKLEWNISLKAGESKKIRFSYSVKYPADKTVILN